jgi:hypothetical protein
MLRIVMIMVLALAACAEEGKKSSGPDGGVDVSLDGGIIELDGPAAELDGPAVEDDGPPPPPPLPTRLWAGVAEFDLGFPVGAATVGYAPGAAANTPYAIMFPGTDAQHTELTAKALVLRNGDTALALVRTDTIGIWQDMVRDVMVRLRELGHADLADGLIVGATHTHSSGGRVFDHTVGEIAVGPFLPSFYMRARDAIVNAVLVADEEAVEAKAGYTTLQIPSLHKDRRCENGPVQDDSMGVIRVSDEEGNLLAVVVNYAMHGTGLGSGWVLSNDAPGAIEHGIEHALDTEAPVLYFQSWAGDMAPSAPDDYFIGSGAPAYDTDMRGLDAIASAAGDLVVPALDAIEMSSDLELGVATFRFPLDGMAINPDGSFDAYPYGGIWCVPDADEENCGENAAPYTSAELACLPFDEEMTVKWGQITAARIGDLGIVTLPGEPCTSVGVALRDAAIASTGLSQVFVVGYAQGYLSYLLHPDDFWMGGYEAASVLMGPHFGEYLIDIGAEVARYMMEPDTELGFVTFDTPDPQTALDYEPLEVPDFAGTPAIVEQPSVDETRVVSARWIGGPPAIDMPVVTLEVETDEGWKTVLRPNGGPIDSRGPEMVIRLEPDPPYGEPSDARTFNWVLWFGLDRDSESDVEGLSGTFRLNIDGMAADGYLLVTEPVLL